MKHWGTAFVALLLLFGMTIPAYAVLPDERLQDPKLEARARELSAQLRCVVCQNQSIDDSDAGIAHDLRILIRERILSGDTDDQVMDFLVARYGEFVLLSPRFSAHTMALWLGPFAILLLGLGIVIYSRRQQQKSAHEAPLSQQELEQLAKLQEK